VQEVAEGRVEVAAMDSTAAMAAVGNPQLQEIAERVQVKLRAMLDRL
jgi:hypothetical protein